MARRRAKKTAKESVSSPVNNLKGAVEKDAQIEKEEAVFTEQEGMPFDFLAELFVILDAYSYLCVFQRLYMHLHFVRVGIFCLFLL